MNAQEFKEKYPHLSHLEGNELWDAMEMAVLKLQPPFISQEGDDEIAETVEYNGYTFNITKGLKRQMDEMFKDYKPATFDKFRYFIPRQINP